MPTSGTSVLPGKAWHVCTASAVRWQTMLGGLCALRHHHVLGCSLILSLGCLLTFSPDIAPRTAGITVGEHTAFVDSEQIKRWHERKFSLHSNWSKSNCHVVKAVATAQPRYGARPLVLRCAFQTSVGGVLAAQDNAAGSFCARTPCAWTALRQAYPPSPPPPRLTWSGEGGSHGLRRFQANPG